MNRWIGLDIGGTKILGSLYGEDDKPIAQSKKKTKAKEGIVVVLDQIFKVIDALYKEIPEIEHSEILGIGVGVPGLITTDGIVKFSPNIPFKDFELQSKIEKKYNVPVSIGNDVNVAMFGEYKFISNALYKNVLGLFIGTGIGGAIIIDSQLYIGQGAAAEFGHIVVNADGAFCGCGAQGCLEAYASKTAMQRYIETQLSKGRLSSLKDFRDTDGAVIKSSTLQNAYASNDPLAVEVIQYASKYLGIAIGSLINMFHPDLFILGGGIIESLGSEMMPLMLKEAERHAMPGLLTSVKFETSKLGDDAGVYGAFQFIKNHI
ncbi:ROK family protein [Fusibacter sp. 3D3]|uniref:ROK family protein n=1 Tax=Fusibacter sp. 3D3 TaxID=1048380 RepID=UPI000853B3A1|nr:ROK family protein [Fusibacter sp. 3D3]GAU79952.1 putative ROK-family transcriptional regulator [Fusibacter sp. 3D3]